MSVHVQAVFGKPADFNVSDHDANYVCVVDDATFTTFRSRWLFGSVGEDGKGNGEEEERGNNGYQPG